MCSEMWIRDMPSSGAQDAEVADPLIRDTEPPVCTGKDGLRITGAVVEGDYNRGCCPLFLCTLHSMFKVI
ncbi:hypothetical protein TNCT_487761 [Trichonephila clavata]|uniref:Uncharacterized protein n=1 Tax=Trichonephila clavata TaxID=2740835 RepID=A0A8X6HE27_TRICU|nr:hypothetical protein TNCT_487761 [Trichonephila clavata]